MLTLLVELPEREKHGSLRILALCSCGSVRSYRRSRVLAGVTTNCGCVNIKHGEHESLTYQCWESMTQRCSNPKRDSYRYYGAKGIKVCARWKDYKNFKADMGERPTQDYSIDRIDPKKDYTPENCRWLLKTENTRRASATRRISR